jgi:hypothetical protein
LQGQTWVRLLIVGQSFMMHQVCKHGHVLPCSSSILVVWRPYQRCFLCLEIKALA